MTLPTLASTTYAAPVSAAHLSRVLMACSLHVATSLAASHGHCSPRRPAVMGARSRRVPRPPADGRTPTLPRRLPAGFPATAGPGSAVLRLVGGVGVFGG